MRQLFRQEAIEGRARVHGKQTEVMGHLERRLAGPSSLPWSARAKVHVRAVTSALEDEALRLFVADLGRSNATAICHWLPDQF